MLHHDMSSGLNFFEALFDWGEYQTGQTSISRTLFKTFIKMLPLVDDLLVHAPASILLYVFGIHTYVETALSPINCLQAYS